MFLFCSFLPYNFRKQDQNINNIVTGQERVLVAYTFFMFMLFMLCIRSIRLRSTKHSFAVQRKLECNETKHIICFPRENSFDLMITKYEPRNIEKKEEKKARA